MKKNIQVLQVAPFSFWEKYAALFLCTLAFILYASTIGNGYNMDDELVTRNHKLTSKGISAIPEIFTSPYYSDDMGYSYEYRPIVLTSFAVEHQFFGDSTTASHFINVLLYVFTVWLLLNVLKKIFHGYSYWYSVLAVLFFIIHPLHSEVVSSIKNRDEILAVIGVLIAWKYTINYFEANKLWMLLVGVIAFLFGILSKMSVAPMAILIPFSLVFFFNPSRLKLLLTSFVYTVFVAFVLFFMNKNKYSLLLFIFACLPYLVQFYISNKELVLLKIKSAYTSFISGLRSTEESDMVFRNLPPHFHVRDILKPIFLISVAIFITTIGFSLWYNSYFILIFGMLIFAVSFYMSTVEERNILLLIFSISITLITINFTQSNYLEYAAAFLFPLFFFTKGYKNLFSILSIAILSISFIYFDKALDYLTLVTFFSLLLVSHRFKRGNFVKYLMQLLISLTIAGSLYRIFFVKEQFEEEFVVVTTSLIYLFVLTEKSRRITRLIVLFLIIPVFPLIHWVLNPSPVNLQSKDKHKVEAVDSQSISAINKFDRPILYAEIPIDSTTTLSEKAGLSTDVLGFYFKKMILPYPLGFYYGYAYFKPHSFFTISSLIYSFIHILLIVAFFLCLRRNKILSFGILFYLGSIALFSSVLYPVVGVVGDRFAYLASVGFSVCIAFVLIKFGSVMKNDKSVINLQPFTYVIIGFLIIFYGFLTINRNLLWKSPLILMSNDIEYLDESAQAHNLYALNLMRESTQNRKIPAAKRLEMQKLAITHFDRAVQIWPGFFNAAYDKGRASVMVNDLPSAIDGFERAILIGTEDGFIQPYIELSQLYLRLGKYSDYLRNAKNLLVKNKDAETYNMVARGFYMTGRADSAKIYIHKGMKLFPQDFSLRKNLAEIYRTEGKEDSASYYMKY